ncbi:hypothetical protein FRC07_006239 [Ceratobasidium sp. 392]|nr:hypothetical protein FRC07_006239 [Ceratobasidium sp. 392]
MGELQDVRMSHGLDFQTYSQPSPIRAPNRLIYAALENNPRVDTNTSVNNRDVMNSEEPVVLSVQVITPTEVARDNNVIDSSDQGNDLFVTACTSYTCGDKTLVTFDTSTPVAQYRVQSEVNPNGKISSAIVGKIIEGLPTIVAKVTQFIRSSGHPPYICTSPISSQLRTEMFDLKAKTHTIKLIAGNQEEELTITVDPKPFGGNWKVQVSGDDNVSAEKTGTSAVIRVLAGSGKVEVRITAA